jgi:ectoine hydroxylase-related dioxygenase (phytanoyl-CoA dioxygenase family)
LEFKEKADAVIDSFILRQSTLIHPNCQYIINPFRHDADLMALVINEQTDQILKILIDEDYVLINATLNNRRLRTDLPLGYKKALGDDWHSDSRYLDGRRLERGFGYLMAVMLDDFTKRNGGTHYVPRSHLRRDIPDRNGDYDYAVLEGEAGTVVVMDSGLWHRAGPSSLDSRWAVFNLFGPWFMKPYFDYPKMIGTEGGKLLTPTLRKLFHFNSIPPLDENENLSTLIKMNK